MNFRYRTSSFDFWQLSMYYIYSSIAGVCNIIFTVALIVLTVSRWNEFAGIWRFLLILGCLFFPLIQPLIIYQKAKKQSSKITHDTEITFDDKGINIRVGEQQSTLEWNFVKGVIKKPTMIIVLTNGGHGYVLANRVLGKDRERLYTYVKSMI